MLLSATSPGSVKSGATTAPAAQSITSAVTGTSTNADGAGTLLNGGGALSGLAALLNELLAAL
jgi:hypothetical protein